MKRTTFLKTLMKTTKMMMNSFDPEDLPDTYYILGTLHGFRFVIDVEEGERIGNIMDTTLLEPRDQRIPMFLKFRDYAHVPARVQLEFVDSFYMSTPESRAFENCFNTDAKKRGWNNDD